MGSGDGTQRQLGKVSTEDQWKVVCQEFWRDWDFPNCVGAIVEKHIHIRAPANSGSSFINYRGFFSFILIAACDAKYRFVFIDIGAYSRDSNVGVFTRKNLCAQLI